MKIIREGDHMFVIGPCGGHGFNVKQIARVTIEDMREIYGAGQPDELFLQIWSAGGHCSIQCSRDDARQMFQDTAWMLILKEHK